jgi:MFS family permease
MITISIMLANIMQGVDNTILNVALPHVQEPGGLWTRSQALTSCYRLRRNHDAMTGWLMAASASNTFFWSRLHARFGAVRGRHQPRRTVSRALQGVAGAGLIPLSQATSYRSARRAHERHGGVHRHDPRPDHAGARRWLT